MSAVLGLALTIAATAASAQGKLDRTTLPIAEPKPPTYTELDARKAKPPARFEVKAPPGAPNVVIVLIDDIGFGGPSTFGGPIRTPTMDQLAQSGLRFNNFHTTALCSPTRNALKTGRNHHTTNTGSIMESSTAFPGNTGQVPNSVAPLAEMLRLNGYSTGAFGKWHETAAWETSVSGPFDRWPTHQGFDKFYGFIGGETDQWYPLVYDGVIKVDPPHTKDYHFTVDMTNQAINWVKAQQSMTPDKPFFVYYATGAVHAPHHVPKEWADKYKGQFDKGWDQVRTETLDRQKKLGVVPANARLGDRPKDIVAWDTLPADQRRLFARQAEVFAGFLEHTDNEIGRFRKALEDIGELDNTLFIYIAGDNGTSAEGGFVGMYNEMTYFNGVTEKVEDLIPLDRPVGRPDDLPAHVGGLGGGLRHALLVDQAGGVRLRRHPQRHGHPLAEGHQGKGRPAQPVLARHRRRPHDPGGRRPAAAQERQRHGADAHRGHQHALRLQRREGGGSPQDPVLRDVRQSRHLPRGLVRPDHPPRALADEQPAAADVRCLGPLRRAERFQPHPEPGRPAAREAEGDAGPVHEGSPEVPRAADRRPDHRAHEPGPRGPAGRPGRLARPSRSTRGCRACSKTPS